MRTDFEKNREIREAIKRGMVKGAGLVSFDDRAQMVKVEIEKVFRVVRK